MYGNGGFCSLTITNYLMTPNISLRRKGIGFPSSMEEGLITRATWPQLIFIMSLKKKIIHNTKFVGAVPQKVAG